MTSKRNIVTEGHAYTLPVVREIPPDPPDAAGTQSLW